MPKTTAEKIATKREQIQQLQNQEKQLLQKQKKEERTARTRRFCSRHGLLEKFMPDLATITDEQYETFIRKGINTSYGQKILAEIVGSTGATAAQQSVETAAQPTPAPTTKPTGTAAQGNTAPTAKPPQAPTQNGGNPNPDKSKTAQQTQAAEPDKSGGGATVTG